MTLEEFGRFMLSHSSGRTVIPSGELMIERTWTAMKKIAKDTIPLRLIVSDPSGHTIIRKPDSETYIRRPDKPILGATTPIDMDDALMDALALYVLAGLEQQKAKTYMGMYWGEINDFNDKLTETYLSEATNDAPRFNKFGV